MIYPPPASRHWRNGLHKGQALAHDAAFQEGMTVRSLLSTHPCNSWPAKQARSVLAACMWGLIGLLTTAAPAWAYKVEKICTDVPASASEPAKKLCKIVRIAPGKEGAAKEEKKEEKKKSGH